MSTRNQYTFKEKLIIAQSRGYLLLSSTGKEYRLKKAYFNYCKECSIPAIYVIQKYKYAYLEVNFESLPRDLTEPEIDKIYGALTNLLQGARKFDMAGKKRFVFVSDVYATAGDFRGGRFCGEQCAKPLFKTINKITGVQWEAPVCTVWD